MGKFDDLIFTIPQEHHSWYGFVAPRGFFRGTTMMEKARVYMDWTAVNKPLPMEVPHTHHCADEYLVFTNADMKEEGTTDITRTIAMGPVTEEMKADFTRVARANLNLMYARFLYGCSGMNLDILAREPFWEAGADFKHGTGHGVGHLLNVHEGPNGFRWRQSPDRTEHAVLEEGMITSDEPGVYLEGKYGIRLENEILCRKGEKNEYGQFMYFENLTPVPFDLDVIDPAQMDEREIRRLNAFHADVYRRVAPLLEANERAWLKEATRPVSRG